MIVALLIIVLVVLALLLTAAEMAKAAPAPPLTEEQQRVALHLHAIRRRLDVADLKHQAQVDTARLRRELDAELAAAEREELT